MTVSKTRHYWTIIILSLVIGILGASLVATKYETGTFFSSQSNPEDAPEAPTLERPFLTDEEVVILEPDSANGSGVILPIENILFEYVEVVDGCEAHFEGECLLVRSGPGTEYPVVSRLRNGVVLKISGQVEHEGTIWYKVVFDEWLRYPERLKGDWYIASDFVQILYDEGDKTIWEDSYSTTSNKYIIVDRTKQRLYAYEGEDVFMDIPISTGLELTPTPQGTFTIFKKHLAATCRALCQT